MASGAVGSLGQRNFRLGEQFAARSSEALAAARFSNLRRKCHISWFFFRDGFYWRGSHSFGLCAVAQADRFSLRRNRLALGFSFGGLALCVLLRTRLRAHLLKLTTKTN